MKRRLFSLLLAALMLLSLLAACGQAETPAASDGDAQTDAPAPSEPETSTEPADESVDEPAAPGEVTLPIAADSTTYTMWVPNFLDAAMSYNDPNEFPIWQELERRTNIHIDWTLATLANAQEQFSLMLTSQDCTDLMAGAPSFLTGGIDYSIDEDIILDLTELVPEYMPNYYALLTADDYSRKTCYTDSGRLGQLQVVQGSPEPPFAGWIARQDMLDAIGFEGSMVTIDDWTTVLAGLKEAGLGKLYLGSASGQQEFLMTTYGVTNGFLQKDGAVFYGPVQQGYHDYLAQITAWNEAGYLDPDFISHTAWYSDFSMMVSGEIAIMPTIYSIYDVIDMMGKGSDPNFAVTAVDVPKLHEGDALMVGNFGGPSKVSLGGSAVCISPSCEDVPTILRWFDYLCTDEGFLLGNYGIEGASYTLVDGEPVYTDLILANPDGLTRGQAQSLYSINTYITQYYDYTRGWGGTSEAALGCMDIWCADYDYVNSYDLPPVTLTIEETENLGSAVNDIATYVEEYSAQVVTGQKNLDATWDEYVAHIEAMNLQRCIEVYQAACDRFNAR